MITSHTITNAAEASAYYETAFTKDGALGADNYYENEKAGATWQGQGAVLLGTEGLAVAREDFIDRVNGKMPNPTTGKMQDLSNNSKGDARRLAVDFTVSAPKSVSVIGLGADGDKRIVEIHKAANATAMAWFEKNASMIRTKGEHQETVHSLTGNLLYSTMQHETSRENEPQLHNHNVIISATFDHEAGKWRSLTNDELFRLRAGGDVIYKAELAAGLKLAGYELEYAKNGMDFEIRGVEQHVEEFSSRKKQINEALRERGFEPEEASWAARQAAALATRAKKTEVPREVLHAVWQEKAREAGLDIPNIVGRALAREKEGGLAPNQSVVAKESLAAVSWAIGHLSEREQSFKRSEAVVQAVAFSRQRLESIESALTHHLDGHNVVKQDSLTGGVEWLTTYKGISAENQLRRNIGEGIGMGQVILTDKVEFSAAIAAFEAKKTIETGDTFKLSAEQVNAAKNVLMHSDVYQGIQGEAGTGKTAALAMVRDVAEAKGWHVMGVATSASAAKELEHSSGIKSQTVAGFFVAQATAIKLANEEIAQINRAIETGKTLGDAKFTPRIEVARLAVTGEGLSLGAQRYTFDHGRGEVFRSTDNFMSRAGEFFLNAADRLDAKLATLDKSRDVEGDFKERLFTASRDVSLAIGRTLNTVEKVGVVESIAARNTLYLSSKDEDRQKLVTQLQLKQAEVRNLQKTGNAEGRKTLLVMDESSQTGAYDTEKISTFAKGIGARVVFQGDIKQHGSVPAGRAFEQAQKAGMNVSILEETRRFDRATLQTRQAIAEMKMGNYSTAIERLDHTIVKEKDLANTVATRYIKNLDELKEKGKESPTVGIVAITNKDRKAINATVHSELQKNGSIGKVDFTKGHLDDPKLSEAERLNVGMLAKARVDRLVFRKTYKEVGLSRGEVVDVVKFDIVKNIVTVKNESGRQIVFNPKKQDLFTAAIQESRAYSVGDRVESRAVIKPALEGDLKRIDNSTRGVISSLDESGASILWSDGKQSKLTNKELRFVDFSYAHTSHKEQGATNDREIFAVSAVGAKVVNREAAYVASTRAKDNSEIVTSDWDTLLKNAGKEVKKTIAIKLGSQVEGMNRGEKVENMSRALESILNQDRMRHDQAISR